MARKSKLTETQRSALTALIAALKVYMEGDTESCGARGHCIYCRSQIAIDFADMVLRGVL